MHWIFAENISRCLHINVWWIVETSLPFVPKCMKDVVSIKFFHVTRDRNISKGSLTYFYSCEVKKNPGSLRSHRGFSSKFS